MGTIKLYKVPEIAAFLQLSVASIYSKVADGSMPHYKLGGAVRISETQLQEFLAKSEQRAAPRAAPELPLPKGAFKHLKV